MTSLLLALAVIAQTPTPPDAPTVDAPTVDAPPPAPRDAKAEAEAAEAESGPWEGSFGLGLSVFTGNSREFMVTGDALAEYEVPKWALTLELDGAYGEAASAEEDEDTERAVTAKQLGTWARGEYRATPLLSAYTYLGAETDHPSNLELRTEAELGMGVTFLEEEKEEDELFLRGYLGLHYARDRRFQYGPERGDLPDVDLWSPALGATFHYDINERVHLREDAMLLPDVFGDTRVLLNSTTKLSVHMTEHFALTTFFELQHDSSPAGDSVRTDTALTLGGELTL